MRACRITKTIFTGWLNGVADLFERDCQVQESTDSDHLSEQLHSSLKSENSFKDACESLALVALSLSTVPFLPLYAS